VLRQTSLLCSLLIEVLVNQQGYIYIYIYPGCLHAALFIAVRDKWCSAPSGAFGSLADAEDNSRREPSTSRSSDSTDSRTQDTIQDSAMAYTSGGALDRLYLGFFLVHVLSTICVGQSPTLPISLFSSSPAQPDLRLMEFQFCCIRP
jgi:hypothetical protein